MLLVQRGAIDDSPLPEGDKSQRKGVRRVRLLPTDVEGGDMDSGYLCLNNSMAFLYHCFFVLVFCERYEGYEGSKEQDSGVYFCTLSSTLSLSTIHSLRCRFALLFSSR